MNKDIITVGDKDSADINLVWFHGYGANNWSFEPFIKLLNLNLDGKLYIIMPNAPIDDGKRSWYPLPKSIDGDVIEDNQGLTDSKEIISKLLEGYLDNNKRLYLGGFSQGAALSLSMGLCNDLSCEGIIAISGYVPSAKEMTILNRDAEIYIAHGNNDTTISIDTHNRSVEFLRHNGYKPNEFIDECGHTISKKMIENLTGWLYKRL
jgi:predicted esterase